MNAPAVCIVGGGMITQVQILPSIYQLQREGVIGAVSICALNARPLKALQDNATLAKGFAGHSFTPYPDPAKMDLDQPFPDLYKKALDDLPAGSVVVIAVPDQMHYPVLKEAIARSLHVCIVKPLVLTHAQAEEIAAAARDAGVVVGVEYHKRFDYRNLMARRAYRDGRLGEMRLAQAQMIEPWYYRHSNFQNWCTCENSDMFTYVGCHYVDLVAFITGLRPVSVSVYGIREKYPNGREGFLWTDGRVIWNNGACLSVVDAIGYPDRAAGGNAQGLTMWCHGGEDATLLVHSDQYRGVKCSYVESAGGDGDTVYAEPNPDYFQLVDAGGGGLTPIGYGHRSVEYIVRRCAEAAALADPAERLALIDRLDAEGIMATPANSSYNELVIEAARKSILAGGREVAITYAPTPKVNFKFFD